MYIRSSQARPARFDINGKTVFGHENPFDNDKLGDVSAIKSGNGGDVVDDTYIDENIEIIFQDLNNSQVTESCVNNKTSEASCSISRSNLKKLLESSPDTTCKKYKSDHIQTSLTSNLENAKHLTGKKESFKTGGGVYVPTTTSGDEQILALFADQVKPLHNEYDDASI
ncbi:hypothetical protein RN001_005816 [Aquatica leii]|uniref:Uncharacterized protein n=1 Tax=Aquatica leii TaxID=1421715 RepID=A0AAN7SI72_9COLE|nr:hypothetical protein RN001_005816 [Aquatica leii]